MISNHADNFTPKNYQTLLNLLTIEGVFSYNKMKISEIVPHLFDIYLYLKLKKVNSGKFGNSDTPSVFPPSKK
jgi:hypothetical protein